MKQYIFEIIIDEENDDFWNSITKSKKSGCDEVQELITTGLSSCGFTEGYGTTIKLKEFKDM